MFLTIFAWDTGLKVLLSFCVGYGAGFLSSNLLHKRKESEKKSLTDKEMEFQMKKLKLILGYLLIIFMLILHTTVAEIPVWVMAFPGFLMGFDPRDWINFGFNKK